LNSPSGLMHFWYVSSLTTSPGHMMTHSHKMGTSSLTRQLCRRTLPYLHAFTTQPPAYTTACTNTLAGRCLGGHCVLR
jgi:hypothetical protein